MEPFVVIVKKIILRERESMANIETSLSHAEFVANKPYYKQLCDRLCSEPSMMKRFRRVLDKRGDL